MGICDMDWNIDWNKSIKLLAKLNEGICPQTKSEPTMTYNTG